MIIKHYILTRFNLCGRNRDKSKQSTLTKEWLHHRIKLFETYCLPSIKQQTNQNFKWLILFDYQLLGDE